MRRRLFEPAPPSLRELPRERRRSIVRAVRAGESVERRRDAKIALDVADWMEAQGRTSYLDLLMTPISLGALVILLILGFVSIGGWVGALANVIPFLAAMLLIRIAARVLFRRAPDARDKNLALLQRRKRA